MQYFTSYKKKKNWAYCYEYLKSLWNTIQHVEIEIRYVT